MANLCPHNPHLYCPDERCTALGCWHDGRRASQQEMTYEEKQRAELAERPSPFVQLCIWCNEPWSPEMEADLEQTGYCDTCEGQEVGEIRISCNKCHRVVYIKEYGG